MKQTIVIQLALILLLSALSDLTAADLIRILPVNDKILMHLA